MHYAHKVKTGFTFANMVFAALMVSGSFLLENLYADTTETVAMLPAYVDYKIRLANMQDQHVAAAFIPFLGATTYANPGDATTVPVLTYHGIVENPDGHNVTLHRFEEQLFALKRAGYTTVSLKEFDAFRRGETELPDKSFLLTFDDGRKDSYYPVDPLLKALDYNAVMFVITRHGLDDESPYYLSRRELARMLKSDRWEIASHGKNDHDFYPIDAEGNEGHFLSNRLWLEGEQRLETLEEFRTRINQDLLASKQDLEASFGIEITGYAYPFGDYGQDTVNFPGAARIIAEVVESIYPLAFYQVWDGDVGNGPGLSAFMVKRISVKPAWRGSDLVGILSRGKL